MYLAVERCSQAANSIDIAARQPYSNASSSSSAGSELVNIDRERVSVDKSAMALKEEERQLVKDAPKNVQKEAMGAERVERESSSIC